jgi:hypothetical protein
MSGPAARDGSSEASYRRALLGSSAAIFLVTPLELLLQEHTGGGAQNLPFFACALGLASTLALALAEGPAIRRLARTVLLLVFCASAFGVWEHIEHNYAFTREIKPQLGPGPALFDALFGASPLLAPGLLGLGAFLAWVTTRDRQA